eukprot:TRINITY_DN83_c0_g1_i1.p2 TRINITY_DN83_c0_g1~~TRINITY_DN83_c0_g1_i1.p2  ORF type:complete len:188 (+),score=70.75 TRINITY_DN83_c0_g1_i1:118-681(+)
MLLETLFHTFQHPWASVSLASWKKYPCESRPDILCVDMISKVYDPQTGILSSKRLTVNRPSLPYWLKRLISSDMIMLEESTVDPINKVMTLKGKNISFNNLVEAEETCTYTVDPNNHNWTLFKQEMKVTAFPFGVAGSLENYSVQKFVENAEKGRLIMEAAIDRVKEETQLTIERQISQLKMKKDSC